MTHEFFVKNRQRVAEKLHGGIVVVPAYMQMQRGNDMAFAFEQEANFWWLTGIEAADWWVIMDLSQQKSWAVAPVVSESRQVFDGSVSFDKARAVSGVNAVITRDESQDLLRQLAKKHSVVYTLGKQPHAEHFDFHLNPAQKKMHDMLGRIFNSVQSCRKELAQLRATKQPEEIQALQGAIDVTIGAFEEVKKRLPTFHFDYEVAAEFTYSFIKRGTAGHAYDPIVASGKNACTLHYVRNDAKLRKKQLILLDIGAKSDGYAADITRTFAIGEPTKRQAEVHTAVQAAHKKIISLLSPGLLVEHYMQEVDRIMSTTLLELGLIKDKHDEESYRKYFPHAVSHGLGVDVHDSLGGPKALEAGMVLTVEPGIYIPEESIGVRIEDDILITPQGSRNLSAKLSTDF
jgi:Xaa-Pro aminopeptidase